MSVTDLNGATGSWTAVPGMVGCRWRVLQSAVSAALPSAINRCNSQFDASRRMGPTDCPWRSPKPPIFARDKVPKQMVEYTLSHFFLHA